MLRVRVSAAICLLVVGCGTEIGDPPGSGDADPNAADGGPRADSAFEPPALADFDPSNLDPGHLTAGTEALVITAAESPLRLNTDNGRLRRPGDNLDLLPAGVAYVRLPQGAGLPDIGVFSATEIVIEPGAQLIVTGGSALALASAGDVLIEGTIVATGGEGTRETPGPGGFQGGIVSSRSGRGPGGGGPGSTSASNADNGGGGGGHGGLGGKGGDRAGLAGGAAGAASGSAELAPLAGGSGGGTGGGLGDGNGGPVDPGIGGGGGGAIQISARGAIRVGSAGGINAGGGGGEGGDDDDGGGGGGAGGGVLFEAAAIHLLGILAANGGGGGAGAEGANQAVAGETGKLANDPATGGTAVQEGTSGGAGGAGTSIDGTAGANAQDNDLVADNAGGGGGAAGRIVLRSRDTGTRTGTTSPAASELPLP